MNFEQCIRRLATFLNELSKAEASGKSFNVQVKDDEDENFWHRAAMTGPFCPKREYRVVYKPREFFANQYGEAEAVTAYLRKTDAEAMRSPGCTGVLHLVEDIDGSEYFNEEKTPEEKPREVFINKHENGLMSIAYYNLDKAESTRRSNEVTHRFIDAGPVK